MITTISFLIHLIVFNRTGSLVISIHLHPIFGRVRVWVGLPEKNWVTRSEPMPEKPI